jgi:hypothetical protein
MTTEEDKYDWARRMIKLQEEDQTAKIAEQNRIYIETVESQFQELIASVDAAVKAKQTSIEKWVTAPYAAAVKRCEEERGLILGTDGLTFSFRFKVPPKRPKSTPQ